MRTAAGAAFVRDARWLGEKAARAWASPGPPGAAETDLDYHGVALLGASAFAGSWVAGAEKRQIRFN